MRIIELKSNNYRAKINLSRGANCISLKNTEYNGDILREPDYDNLDNPYLYGMPILFPPNRISGGKFEFEGREYTFPINEEAIGCFCHGTLHDSEFKIVSQTENSIVCSYIADKENPYHGFPHEFEIRLTYLLDDALTIKAEIFNNSDENMPVFLAFHTTFNIPFIKGGKAEDIRFLADVGEEYLRDINYLPTGEKSKDEILEKINTGEFRFDNTLVSKHCTASEKGRIELIDTVNKLKLVYENDEKYKFRMIYKSEDESYICPEPQTCLTNCVNMDVDRETSGFDYIPPKEKKEYYSKIYIEKI